jgi:hypothetical protein
VLSRRVRWSVPAVVILTGVAIGVLPGLSASAGPSLPPISAQALLTKALSEKVLELSGTVTTSTDLGLPSIPSGDLPGGASSLLSLITGANTFKVWLNAPAKDFRGAWIQSGQESDLYVTPSHIYTWDSATDSVGELDLSQLGALLGGSIEGSAGSGSAPLGASPATASCAPPPPYNGWSGYAPSVPCGSASGSGSGSSSSASPVGTPALSTTSPLTVASPSGRRTLTLLISPVASAAQVAALARELRGQQGVTRVMVRSGAAQLAHSRRGLAAQPRKDRLRLPRGYRIPTTITATLTARANPRVLARTFDHSRWVRAVSGPGGDIIGSFESTGREVPPAPSAPNVSLSEGVTPATIAEDVLREVGKDATISVGDTATVAGRAAYVLTVTPTSSDSLVASIDIAIDSTTGLPLRVQVLARGQSSPALSIGFSSLSIGAPPASVFDFTVPSGASVHPLMAHHGSARPHNAHRGGATPGSGGQFAGVHATGPSHVIGHGWSAIDVIPGVQLGTLTGLVSGLTVHEPGGGELISTSLLTFYLAPDHTLYVGSVTPAAILAAAGG